MKKINRCIKYPPKEVWESLYPRVLAFSKRANSYTEHVTPRIVTCEGDCNTILWFSFDFATPELTHLWANLAREDGHYVREWDTCFLVVLDGYVEGAARRKKNQGPLYWKVVKWMNKNIPGNGSTSISRG